MLEGEVWKKKKKARAVSVMYVCAAFFGRQQQPKAGGDFLDFCAEERSDLGKHAIYISLLLSRQTEIEMDGWIDG